MSCSPHQLQLFLFLVGALLLCGLGVYFASNSCQIAHHCYVFFLLPVLFSTASKATQPTQWSGKIVVRSRNENYKLSIPYQATVLHG